MTRKIKIDSSVDGDLQVGAYTLPATDGAGGQTFTTDGSGSIGWDNVSVTNLDSITNNTIVGNLSGSLAAPTEVSVTTDLTTSAGTDELATGDAIKTYVDDNVGGGGGDTIQVKAPSGTTETINWDDGAIVELDASNATGNITLTLQNPINGTYLIEVTQGVTQRDIIFPAGTKQGNGVMGGTVAGISNSTQLINVIYKGSYFITTGVFE